LTRLGITPHAGQAASLSRPLKVGEPTRLVQEPGSAVVRLSGVGYLGAVVRGAVVIACAVSVSACGQSQTTTWMGEQPRDSVSIGDGDAVPDLAAAADALGLAMISLAEGNVVTSPAGAQVVLAMVGEGAAGPAATSLDALLGASGQRRTDAVNALLADLARLDGDPRLAAQDDLPERTLVHLANQVTVDDRTRITPSYLDRLSTGYGAGITGTDLSSDQGKKVLDEWVRRESGGLVKESAIEPAPDLRLVWQNALVIAARWQQPFDPVLTSDESFTLADGQAVPSPMMRQSVGACYAEHHGWRAVRLPYDGGDLVADMMLPPPGHGPTDLNHEGLLDLTRGLDCGEAVTDVQLYLPVLDLNTRLNLLPLLEQVIPGLLTPGGLPAISSAEQLSVSQAVQQGVLRVDEEGTVAAVVTEVGAAGSAAAAETPIALTFDRPYLVRIATTSTQWPLVLARVDDPRAYRP